MNTFFLFFIGLPALEIFFMIKIGSKIGALNTVALIFLTAIIGVYFARLQGIQTLKSGMINLYQNKTPIYEIIMSFILFGFLWYLRKKINIPGMIFGIYLIVSGLERFLIEKIRVNTTYTLFGKEITQAEIISSIMVIIGIFIVYQLYSNNKKKQLSL